MHTKMDLTGKRFGRLKVISEAAPYINKKGNKFYRWNCICDCGNKCIADAYRLKYGQKQSCGCYNKEQVTKANFKNLEGQVFGRLIAISYFRVNNLTYWHCKCSCGNYKDVLSSHLLRGLTKSCGCLHKEVIKKVSSTHGLSNTRIYAEWLSMKYRCENPKATGYKNYGGKGITVCKQWINNFPEFYKWAMSNGYNDSLTIERKDFNGNYCPENCCWIPRERQSRNTSRTVFLEYDGKKQSMMDWSEEYNIPYSALCQRIRKGWSMEEALFTPVSFANKKNTHKHKA